MKRFGCGLALLLVLLAGFLAWRARTPPHVGNSIPLSQLPPSEQERRREDARVLTDKVRELAKSARSNEKKPFTLTASEDQLNTLVQDNLKSSHVTVSDPHVGLEPGILALQGKVKYNGIDVVATLHGPLLAQDGKLLYQVDSLHLAGLPAPAKLKDKVQDAISKNLNDIIFKSVPVTVQKVTVEQGSLTISGTTE